MSQRFKFIFFLLTVFYANYGVGQGKTMNVNSSGIEMKFVQTRTKITASELASNVLQIINGTNKELDLTLQINPPAGWKSFGKQNTLIHLNPKDSFFIPVRVSPGFGLKGNTNYVVNAYLSTETFTITSSVWYIAVEKISKWQALPSSNKVYFTTGSDTANFSLYLSNDGNSDEILDIQAFPEKNIFFINAQGEATNESSRQIILRVGTDTNLYYTVKKSDDVIVPSATDPNPDNSKKNYRIKLKVINEKAGKGVARNWTGSIEFFKLSDERFIEKSSSKSLPVIIDFQTYNLLAPSSYASLNILGTKRFKNNAFLNYYYQADFVKNELDLKSFPGSYYYLGYFNRFFELELGDIGANKPGSTLNGKGAKMALNFLNNKIGALYVRSPSLFDNYFIDGFGLFHSFKSKIFSIDNYYQHTSYIARKITTDFATTDLNIRIFRAHTIKIGLGYSNENHYWIADSAMDISGLGVRFGYSSSFKKLNYSFLFQSSTPSYVPARGLTAFQGSINYRLNDKYSLSFAGNRSEYKPEMYSSGKLQLPLTYNKQEVYNFRLTYRNRNYSMVFNPTYYTLKSNLVEANTGGLNIEYRLKSRTELRYYFTVFGGFTAFPTRPDLNKIFISNTKLSVMYKMFQANLRYSYGPYYAIEQMQYMQNKINPQKFYSTFYYDYWFAGNKVKLNLNANYIYTIINNRHQFNTRPELFFYSKMGIIFNFYARYLLYADGEQFRTVSRPGIGTYSESVPATTTNRFEIGTGVKLNFNMPVGPSRNYDVKIIAFRDLNGNGVKDPSEKGIDNMLIRLKINDSIAAMINTAVVYGETMPTEFELITNSDGVVMYNNVPMGDYIITALPLASMGGWFDGKTFYKNISKNQVFYIPLSKGARVSGGILTERELYSDNKVLILNNIRVSAQSLTDGKTFSTLTGQDGSFTLYVPNGEYVVSINESAVGEKWEFLQNNIPLKVEEDFENYNISFYLVEKKRTIRLSNAGNSGKTSNSLPVQRTTESSNQNNLTLEPNYLAITTPEYEGKKWVVKLYPNEGPKMHKASFDTLSSFMQVRCIEGENKGLLYISQSFNKKSDAKDILDDAIRCGFKDAEVIQINFGKAAKPPKQN